MDEFSKFRRPALAGLSLSLVFALVGCTDDQPPGPPLERLERILAVTCPDDAKVIGGTESSSSSTSTSLWLITSSEPLPLPPGSQPKPTRRQRKPPQREGTPFPVSALLNLMAAAGVSADDVPVFPEDRGRSILGDTESGTFCYREVATDRGWLTAVEVQSNAPDPLEP